jgi:type IV pilus secretin PilQ/predicted competence protein
MSKHGMLILAALAALLLAGGPFAAGESAFALAAAADPVAARNLKAVEVSTDSGGHPVVTLSGDGAISYEPQVLERPSRLVLDLPGVVSRLATRQIPVGKGGLARVRAGQYRAEPSPVTRVVFDLDETVPYRIERQGSNLVVSFDAAARTPAVTATAQATSAPEPVTARQIAPAADLPTPARPAEPLAKAPAAPAEAAPVAVAEKTPEALAAADPPAAAAQPAPARSLAPQSLQVLLEAMPTMAAEEPAPPAAPAPAPFQAVAPPSKVPAAQSFETKTIAKDQAQYTGKRLSLNLVDADIKQVFRLFHEISGLNFVLDPSVEGRVTIVLDNAPWDQALDIILKNNGLDKVMEDNVIRIASTQKLAAEAAGRKQLKEAKELEVEPTTVTRTLSYAKAKEVERVIRDGGVLSPRGRVIVDERTNTLIISDIPKKVEPLDKLISTLDAETPQVMIEARIVETSREFVQDFGVKWGFSGIADASRGTATSLAFPHNAAVQYGLNLPGGGGASNLAFKFGNVLDSFTLDLALNALETEGRGRILSSPKIATQNNERAEIEQGVRIPVVNTTATEINVEFVSASLKLGVTPQITAEGTIILDVSVENNSPDFVNRVGDVPPIRTQRAVTKILISDGGTTVIGGIFTINEAASESGVPWFRKLPVLGWLFKQKNITNENRELLIFITPKILKVS